MIITRVDIKPASSRLSHIEYGWSFTLLPQKSLGKWFWLFHREARAVPKPGQAG